MLIPSFAIVDELLTFFFHHAPYWCIPLALGGEVVYLSRTERRQRIGMKGWGTATRIDQPTFYYFLWSLHLAASLFFALLFVSYVAHQLR